MGQKSLDPKLSLLSEGFSSEQWIIQPAKRCGNNQIGYPDTLRNIRTQKKLDRYQTRIQSYWQLNKCFQIFLWRRDHPFIVEAYYLLPQYSQKICSENIKRADLYVEHSNWRLSQIKDIPFPENIYCLQSILRGYQSLYKFYGDFQITEEQVCVDSNGQVSVWFNSNMGSFDKQKNTKETKFEKFWKKYKIRNSMSTPQDSEYFQKLEQQEMIQKIINMVVENTDNETEPIPSLTEYFQMFRLNNEVDFEKTLNMIDEYIQNIKLKYKYDYQGQQEELNIPNRMNSILFLNKSINKNKKNDVPIKKQQNQYILKIKNNLHHRNKVIYTERIGITGAQNYKRKRQFFQEQIQKRPITYDCQSLPNKNKQVNLEIHNNQQFAECLKKNKSSESINQGMLPSLNLNPSKNIFNPEKHNKYSNMNKTERINPSVRNKTHDSQETQFIGPSSNKQSQKITKTFRPTQNQIQYSNTNIINLGENYSKKFAFGQNNVSVPLERIQNKNIFYKNLTSKVGNINKQFAIVNKHPFSSKNNTGRDPFFRAQKDNQVLFNNYNFTRNQIQNRSRRFSYFSSDFKEHQIDKDIAVDLFNYNIE